MSVDCPPETFFVRCQAHARRLPARAAVVTDGIEINYAVLISLIEEGAAFLTRSGIGRDAIVGLTIADEVHHLIASLSLLAIGARQITLATHDPPQMREQLAGRVGVTDLLLSRPDWGGSGRPLIWTGLHRTDAGATDWRPANHGEGGLFLRTSGTTGKPNILAFSEAQIGLQAERHSEYADERMLRLAGIEHNNSKRHRLYCVWNGGTNVFVDNRNPDLVDFIRTKRVTCLDISRRHAEGLPHLKDARVLEGIKIRTGGSAIPYATRKSIEQSVSRHLFVRYATSETGAISMAMPGEHDVDECSGRPIDGVELRIVDASGSVVPQGTVGEIALRTPGMVTAYFGNEAQTAARFRDGWFYPGDVGLIRSDGQLVVQGRKDEMIIMNGLNIFPKEIESVLESHPAIRIAAALALPSRTHGDIPVAAVELAANSELSGPDIQRWAHGQLGPRSPKRIVIVDRLPRNSQGKITKKDLLPLFERK